MPPDGFAVSSGLLKRDKSKSRPPAEIAGWREATVVLQKYPGAKGTKMHKVIDEPGTFVGIADWESKAARDAVQVDIEAGQSELGKIWQTFPKNEEFGEVGPVIGAEEIGAVFPASDSGSQ